MTEFDEYGFKVDDVSFKRPRNQEDIRYRKIVLVTFESRLKDIVPKDFKLCFHGTPIWNAKEIIESGNISALADRVGFKQNGISNYGKISVSTINTLWFTIKYHADLYNYDYPAGCIFVIKPKNKDEINSSINSNRINNVYFYKTPYRLKAIITTPENIDMVKKWIAESKLNINPNIVVDYNEFIELVSKKYQKGYAK